jgi:hypothetical protein
MGRTPAEHFASPVSLGLLMAPLLNLLVMLHKFRPGPLVRHPAQVWNQLPLLSAKANGRLVQT